MKRAQIKVVKQCPIIKGLDILEKKWSLRIIISIMQGINRFNSIQRHLQGITPKMLSMRLKELEHEKVIEKRYHGKFDVEYAMNPEWAEAFKCLVDTS